jgi:Putative transposase/Transposase zinc-binding domain
MLEVADIVRLHGNEYRAKFQSQLTGVQKKALRDIQNCRTPFFGGHVYQCGHCGGKRYSYHSCRNRSCPKCHQDQTERWMAQQRQRLLPCPYYLITFTLPSQLRSLARAHPKIVYGLLMKTAAAALQKLADDPRFLGARLGVLSVLHTWTRAMLYHPHVHMLVTAGGLSADGQWLEPKNPKFLVPVHALSAIFRAKMCAALKRARLLQQVDSQVWNKSWVVHCQHAGSGEKVLQYLGRYVFRIALTNNRLETFKDGQVTFRYRSNQTQQIQHCTISALEFLQRFLQHVLPAGCTKVRYYGIFSPHCHKQLLQVQSQIQSRPQTEASPESSPKSQVPQRCPLCRTGTLILVETLQRIRSP